MRHALKIHRCCLKAVCQNMVEPFFLKGQEYGPDDGFALPEGHHLLMEFLKCPYTGLSGPKLYCILLARLVIRAMHTIRCGKVF